MTNEFNGIALKAARHLADKFGYVVVNILPCAHAIPAGSPFYSYSNHPLDGHVLKVTHKTRQADYERQVRSLEENGLLRPGSYKYGNNLHGSRFFRCALAVDDDVPF